MEFALDHIGMMVSDVDESLAFYHDHFGFEAGDRAVIPRDGGLATLQYAHKDGITLEFVQPHAGYTPQGAPPIHISFRVKDINAEIARLKAEGVVFDRADEVPLTGRTPKHRLAFCVGPAMERIELMCVLD
ncbi:MAG: VOC family protein [Clostridia bacterium]|nr:VOC family protein [Clostridia bacterium]